MTQETYSANIHSSDFPFLSKNLGETIILPRYDHTNAASLTHGKNNTKSTGIPQAYYMHNVLPTEYGFQSVQYRKVASNAVGTAAPYSLVEVLPLYHDYHAPNPYKHYWAVGLPDGGFGPTGGSIFAFTSTFDRTPAGFTAITPSLYFRYATTAPMFLAYAQQKNYWVRGTDLVEYYTDDTGDHFILQPTGLGIAFYGVIQSQGYLIGWTANNVYWGSLTTPYNFVPSQVTGAGGGSIGGLIGGIVCCVSTLNGFIIFGKENVVFAAYTGNTRYPFSFGEVKNASGIPSGFAVTNSGASGVIYSLTTSGFQTITGNVAETVVPDLHLFLQNRQLETYDTVTDSFNYEAASVLSTPNLYVRLTYVANKYVCISYGRTVQPAFPNIPTYSYVLIYDTVLLRWGKLKKEHTCIYTHTDNANYVAPVSTDYIGLAAPDGNLWVVDMAPDVPIENDCVLILGKYQRDRGRFMKLEEVNAQFIDTSANFSLQSYFTYDGKTKAGCQTGFPVLNKAGVRKYAFDINAYNHSLVLKGGFHVNTLNLTHADGGDG